MIIAIDGPAGTGKSTIAKTLAKRLGFSHFDTGATYRAVTWGLLQYGIDPQDGSALQNFFNTHPLTIQTREHEKHYFLAKRDITREIRLPEVTQEVSRIAAYPAIRKELVKVQRAYVKEEPNTVFEGRDMGTVVFPNAELKIFLTASPEVRAKRRYKELVEQGLNNRTTFEQVLHDITERDRYDSQREVSPMRPAEDAIVVDTSELSIEQVIETIIALIK